VIKHNSDEVTWWQELKYYLDIYKVFITLYSIVAFLYYGYGLEWKWTLPSIIIISLLTINHRQSVTIKTLKRPKAPLKEINILDEIKKAKKLLDDRTLTNNEFKDIKGTLINGLKKYF